MYQLTNSLIFQLTKPPQKQGLFNMNEQNTFFLVGRLGRFGKPHRHRHPAGMRPAYFGHRCFAVMMQQHGEEVAHVEQFAALRALEIVLHVV